MAKPCSFLIGLLAMPWHASVRAAFVAAWAAFALLAGPALWAGQPAMAAEAAGAYAPTQPATRRWVLCAVVPHIKDAYWLGVNHGMAEEAKRLGVEVRMAEAGGYAQVAVQREQISACAQDARVQGVIVGAVTRDVLTPELRQATAHLPVVAMVNAIADAGISGKVGVNWEEMGAAAGVFLVSQARGEGPPIPVAWFPGPRSVSEGVDRKFREAIAGSRIVIRSTSWGDTGKAVQRNLLQQVLDRNPDVRYVVGNALMAEAAISVLRERGLRERIGIVSTYFTPAIHRGILRGSVMAAATDSPVLQGRMAIGMAVDLLEKRPVERHIAPPIRTVDAQTIHAIDVADSLPPALLAPQFVVLPVPTR
mgnify:CR=1 FL=1